MFEIYKADFPLALWVADNLREEDARELETASGCSAHEAIFRSLASSSYRYCAFYNGKPHSLFGIVDDPEVDEAGIIWMVGTPLIEETKVATYKQAKGFLVGAFKEYKYLWNRVDMRNTLHVKWLKSLGFTFGEVERINGWPFQEFHKARDD